MTISFISGVHFSFTLHLFIKCVPFNGISTVLHKQINKQNKQMRKETISILFIQRNGVNNVTYFDLSARMIL